MATGLGGEQLWLSPTVANNVNPYDDQSGQGNNGTNNGSTVVSDTASGGSYAFDFDGVNDYIDTTNILALGSGEWAMSLWAMTSSSSAGTMLSTYNQTNGKWISTEFNGDVDGGTDLGTVRAGIDDNTTKKITNSYAASYNDGTWRHFVVERNNTDQKLRVYESGASVSSIAIGSYGDLTSSVPLRIGSNNTVSSGFFTGKLDDIRAYDRTLTQAEITHLAEARGVEGPPPVGLGDETNWYCPSLNEGADITGNASFSIGSNTIVSDTGSGGTNALSFGTVSTSTMDQATDHYGGLADMSNSVWIKIDVNNSPNFYSYGSSSKRNPWAFCNPTYLYFQTNAYSEVNTPSNGVWVHFCFVKSGTTQRLYIDGSLASTDACQATTYTNSNGNFTFNSAAKGGFYIDDFRGYTRALTQVEITHLATSRGVLGPPGGATHYNPFKTHAFTNNFQQRLR